MNEYNWRKLELGKACRSASQFSSCFRKISGKPPSECLSDERIKMFYRRKVYHPNGESVKTTKQFSVYRGLILAILSGISFSMVSVLVKQMKNLHPGQLSLYRLTAIFIMSLPETVKNGVNPLGPPNYRLLLVLRGILGGINVFLNFLSFQYLSIGEASVIIFSSPAVVTIFARIFFKEPCNVFQTFTVILTIIGVVFITKLPSHLTEVPVTYSSEKVYGFVAAVFALFSVSFLMLLTRKIRSVHQSVINFNYGVVGILEVVCLTAIFGNFKWHQCGIQNLYILLLALFSYTGLTFMVMALQCEYAGPVSTGRAAVDIAMAFLWQIFIFHDTPDVYGIIGAILVLVSIILIGFSKWLNSLEGNLFSCERFKCFSS